MGLAAVTTGSGHIGAVLAGLGVMIIGLLVVIFSRRIAGWIGAIPSSYQRSRADVQLGGLVLMGVGAIFVASVLLGP